MNKPSMFPRMSYCIDGGRLLRPSVFGVRSIYVCMYRNHRRRRGQIERGMPRAHARGLKSLYSMIWPGVREGSEGPGRGRLQAARRRVGRYGSIDGRMHDDGGAAVAARRRRGDLYNISSCKTPSLARPPTQAADAGVRAHRGTLGEDGMNLDVGLPSLHLPGGHRYFVMRAFFGKALKSWSHSR